MVVVVEEEGEEGCISPFWTATRIFTLLPRVRLWSRSCRLRCLWCHRRLLRLPCPLRGWVEEEEEGG